MLRQAPGVVRKRSSRDEARRGEGDGGFVNIYTSRRGTKKGSVLSPVSRLKGVLLLRMNGGRK